MKTSHLPGCGVSALLMVLLVLSTVSAPAFPGIQNTNPQPGIRSTAALVDSSFSQTLNYKPSLALEYAQLVHTKYYHAAYYPAGINESILQKNLDHFNSEDCAHFVSEALIAGGLTVLAGSPPADNLSTYDQGAFNGSYGIVGVYRLADYLAGYDLPVFPNNATTESKMGYQPIPASYAGSPRTSVYYVLNDSMLPSYFLSPGDVIVDGGAGNGHVMLYTGNGSVIQTDPANEFAYAPGVDYNISFYGLLTLGGKNVSALYMHMPTFSGSHSVAITALNGGVALNASSARVASGSVLSLIASFPDGVGYGNYTYRWSVNGHQVSSNQTFTYRPVSGENNITVVSTGSAGSATASYTIFAYAKSVSGAISPSVLLLLVSSVSVLAAASALIIIRRKKK